MKAYYNENDPQAAAWLRELIKCGHIAAGDVDERSIADVSPDDLKGYAQVHLFAGIGGWSHALRLAGWPDDREVWTGSCPCPPFSSAGKKKRCPHCNGRPIPCPRRTGFFICIACEHAWFADARHLWPEMWRLVSERRPPVIAGEQVAGADGIIWLAGVRASLEILGYGVRAADLCAAGAGEEGEGWFVRGGEVYSEPCIIGSPQIRQRLWWMADADSVEAGRAGEATVEFAGSGAIGRLGIANSERRDGQQIRLLERGPRQAGVEAARASGVGGMGHSERDGLRISGRTSADLSHQPGYWTLFDLIPCRDGKTRRVEPGTFPLAHGLPARVGRLRGYGNSINPQVAARFIEAAHSPLAIAKGEM